MEMLIIAVVTLIAFAAVLVPLMRRRPSDLDRSEFDTVQRAPGSTVSPMAAGPVHSVAAAAAEQETADTVEAEVLRYREAVRAGTVCRKCGQANPADSLYCFECGATLETADAREFE